jgi:hypothetical protein
LVEQGTIPGTALALSCGWRRTMIRVSNVKDIVKAVSEAMREAKRRHKLLGNPIVVWKDGKVVWVPPEEIELD